MVRTQTGNATKQRHIADAIATRNSTSLRDIREQMTLISSYLLGARLAGVLTVNKLSVAVLLPLIGWERINWVPDSDRVETSPAMETSPAVVASPARPIAK